MGCGRFDGGFGDGFVGSLGLFLGFAGGLVGF
jgi:hypothetical protein